MDRSQLTPMMKQYLNMKDKNPDALLFFRLGDFYEMFFEDAVVASKTLNIALTGRDAGLEERVPMCGVPHHVIDQYIPRLLSQGFKVAICEQTEDPSEAKGLVKRDVIKILTPGTYTNYENSDHRNNNYVMSVYYHPLGIGVAYCDFSTGEVWANNASFRISSIDSIINEFSRVNPNELLYNEELSLYSDLLSRLDIMKNINKSLRSVPDKVSKEVLKELEKIWPEFLKGRDVQQNQSSILAIYMLIMYLHETQKSTIQHLKPINNYSFDKYMVLDNNAFSTLELVRTLYTDSKEGSLYNILDKTKTAMGSRLLRQWIELPLKNEDEILGRQNLIEIFHDSTIIREELRKGLTLIYDLDRLVMRIATGNINGRDLLGLSSSLKAVQAIKLLLDTGSYNLLNDFSKQIHNHSGIVNTIDCAINEDPSISIRDGNVIKTGYNEELDKYRKISVEGKQLLAQYESKLRKETGIKNIKVRHNRILGYYIEVTKSNIDIVPEYFIRKQTLVGSERYFTEELKLIEEDITLAGDKAIKLEYILFSEIIKECEKEITNIQESSHSVAKLDCLCSLSYVAYQNHYIKPTFNKEGIINIKGGRHPVVEKLVKEENFIPNDIIMSNKSYIHLITGPNMSGKSTYMRQIGIIVIMAQIGSFVPAEFANICLIDRIFTRIGAADNLSKGESTFMVEMKEVATILKESTKDSLVILDEVGRGTSTYDGLSIAWAVIEHIHDFIKAKTLFATHYHELTSLAEDLPGVENYNVIAEEYNHEIKFLRKVVKGSVNKSYGIQVAKLAGINNHVINRAWEVLDSIEVDEITSKAAVSDNYNYKRDELSTSLIKEILSLDINNISPMAAFGKLHELIVMVQNSEDNDYEN
ncbi:MAG: DNA mismatch repair protein MutS [Tissierellia bacterium]|nr:DNA mismatch repair protein MutS [Tissierellia bacterium]